MILCTTSFERCVNSLSKIDRMSRFSFFFLSVHFRQLYFAQLFICALHPTAPSPVREFSVTLNPFWQRLHLIPGCMAVLYWRVK